MNKTRLLCFFSLIGVLAWSSGCTTTSRGYASLKHLVLVICKISPEQKAAAQEHVDHYFSEVNRHEKPRPHKRYVSVQTLDPNPKQTAKYLQTREKEEKKATEAGQTLSPDWTTDPSQLHCVMVFDIEEKQFVGSGCYVVSSLPTPGQTVSFETFSTQYIGAE
jgi:hypothetical protein